MNLRLSLNFYTEFIGLNNALFVLLTSPALQRSIKRIVLRLFLDILTNKPLFVEYYVFFSFFELLVT